MKLELLDAYSIRARLSVSIILLAPIAITVFFSFEEVRSFATSTVLLVVLLAFTNYVPIMQRSFCMRNFPVINYAAQLLYINDETISKEVKQRYYAKLSYLDKSFSIFKTPEDSDAFKSACESAVTYLRSRTRDNHLVQEENINYGFCKNLFTCKYIGIIISAGCSFFILLYSFIKAGCLCDIPVQSYLAFVANTCILLFWIFGVTKMSLQRTGIYYAKALLSAIDTLT